MYTFSKMWGVVTPEEAAAKIEEQEEKVIFGGLLGEYKYYDMDAVIVAALELCEREMK